MIEVYTDGACHPNPGEGGWCAILLINGREEVLAGGANYTTNNRMEMMAMLQALHYIKQNGWANTNAVKLYTDSMYVVNGINKLQKNTTLKTNTDLWNKGLHIIKGFDIEVIWVRGHDGNKYNELCDEEAVRQKLLFRELNANVVGDRD